MPMGVPMQRVFDVAAEIAKTHTAYDFKPGSAVRVYHDDGTDYWFENAFAVIYYDKDHGNEGGCSQPGHWLMVFTEHHGHHVFHLDDLERGYSVWERGEVPKHPNYPPYQWECEACEHQMIEPQVLLDVENHIKNFVCPTCGKSKLKRINEYLLFI